MKPRLALIARDIIVSSDSGIPSAINIIEGIMASSFPFIIPNISFLGVWVKEEKDSNEAKGTLHVLVNEQEIINSPVEINFKANEIARCVTQLQGLTIEKPSTITFRVELGGTVNEYSIFSKSIPQALKPAEEAA